MKGEGQRAKGEGQMVEGGGRRAKGGGRRVKGGGRRAKGEKYLSKKIVSNCDLNSEISFCFPELPNLNSSFDSGYFSRISENFRPYYNV